MVSNCHIFSKDWYDVYAVRGLWSWSKYFFQTCVLHGAHKWLNELISIRRTQILLCKTELLSPSLNFLKFSHFHNLTLIQKRKIDSSDSMKNNIGKNLFWWSTYRKVASIRPLYYSILEHFCQRSQYISLNFLQDHVQGLRSKTMKVGLDLLFLGQKIKLSRTEFQSEK